MPTNIHIVARHEHMTESPWQPPLIKEKQSPGPLIQVFHQTAATHERFFHPIDARCVFFHYPLMNIETALTHEELSLDTHEGWASAMPI